MMCQKVEVENYGKTGVLDLPALCVARGKRSQASLELSQKNDISGWSREKMAPLYFKMENGKQSTNSIL